MRGWHLQVLSLLGISALLVGIHRVVAFNEELKHHHDVNHHHHVHDNDDNNNGNHSAFCHGMSLTMFMDGFRFSLHSDSNNSTSSSSSSTPPCLAYYFSSWKLNMSGKFRGAMVFSFLLALLTEGLAATRFVLIDYIHKKQRQQQQQQSSTSFQPYRKIILTIIYALQSWMGTMIMLVSMMYSIELLLSVVAGLMVGNFLFVREHPQKQQGNINFRRMMLASGAATTTGNNTSISNPPLGLQMQEQAGATATQLQPRAEERTDSIIVEGSNSRKEE